MSNHLLNQNGKLQPSALIPFCASDGNSLILGKMIENFSNPVCSAFQPELYKGQQCYSLDIENILKEKNVTIRSGREYGLSFLVDENLGKTLSMVSV